MAKTRTSRSMLASDPFTAITLDASALQSENTIYCELLVKPQVMTNFRDEEFLDFNGAILGFFTHEKKGEILVLSSRNKEEALWISTNKFFRS